MAYFHKHLTYHKDTTPKHSLTAKEIEFLRELQKEMNTQDHCGNADPQYWVIRGSEKEYGIEEGYEDGADVLDEEGNFIAGNLSEFVQYIRDELLEEINYHDGFERTIEFETFPDNAIVTWNEEEETKTLEFDSPAELAEWLNDMGYSFGVANYRVKEKNYPDVMFLTQTDAAKHLEANSYHYSEDAHTYAMTAWRSLRVEALYDILQKVDWNELLAQTENDGWIPVFKGLPEEKEDPVTQDFVIYPVTVCINGIRSVKHYAFGRGHWWNGPGMMDEYVLAWMPVPQVWEG